MNTLLTSKALFILFIFVNGESRVTHIRIPVNPSVEEKQSTFTVMRARDHKLSRSRSEIWKWDYWCQLQPKIGSCSDKLQKFYYDAQLDQCVTFPFGGCNGNENNFDSLVECERHCKGSAFMELKEITDSEICSLQPNSGLCLATFTKYYFDVNEGTCLQYIYGGCGGNLNRFSTKYKCLKQCGVLR